MEPRRKLAKLFFVVGTPSGGTSAAAGALQANNFYSSRELPNTEPWEARVVFLHKFLCGSAEIFSRQERPIRQADFAFATKVFTAYKKAATNKGFEYAVLKWPGVPVWCPDILDERNLGTTIYPILIARDPYAAAESSKRFCADVPNAPAQVFQGQERIRELHQEYGWPMWEFSPSANIEELAAIVNAPLNNRWFDPATIKNY